MYRPVRKRSLSSAAVAAAASCVFAAPCGASDVPVIPARDFAHGDARVEVTGLFRFEATIPINAEASIGDGEMTWLQYGVSGADTPNSLVTVSTQEIGLSVSVGKKIATATAADCTGKMSVSGTSVGGKYRCTGVAAYDAGSGAMGEVSFEIEFTAD
jgi:hypothetical protein